MYTGNLRTGAVIIANARDSEYGRAVVIDEYMELIPKFIRTATENSDYTDDDFNVPLGPNGRKK